MTIDEWSGFSQSDLERFGDEGDNARRTLLDPTILRLMGEVEGKTILDAGCGNGYLSRKLAQKGAAVTGVEPSENLFRYCLKRESEQNLGVTYIQQDLTDLVGSDAYDAVTLINVLMDIPKYQTALTNCVRTLKTGGIIIISILHPAFPGFESDWQKLGHIEISEYFSPQPLKQKYGHLFHRPIQDYLNALIDDGCSIERIVEPQLSDKKSALRSAHVPQFLVIKARKI